MPAPQTALATVEDVGSGLLGDFVARWWITWFLFEEVRFVNYTFQRVLQHLLVRMKSAKRASV